VNCFQQGEPGYLISHPSEAQIMHYQTRLLPLDDAGGFLLAIIHGEHKIGGEDTRETQYARLAVGHVDMPGQLRDLAAAAFPKRPASPGAVKY
jgi:hypothetical protein